MHNGVKASTLSKICNKIGGTYKWRPMYFWYFLGACFDTENTNPNYYYKYCTWVVVRAQFNGIYIAHT